jgi:hypothetical protein
VMSEGYEYATSYCLQCIGRSTHNAESKKEWAKHRYMSCDIRVLIPLLIYSFLLLFLITPPNYIHTIIDYTHPLPIPYPNVSIRYPALDPPIGVSQAYSLDKLSHSSDSPPGPETGESSRSAKLASTGAGIPVPTPRGRPPRPPGAAPAPDPGASCIAWTTSSNTDGGTTFW